MLKSSWGLVVLVLLISACSPRPVVHDKAYFAANDADREKTIATCRNNPGELASDPNCVNAVAAQADVDREKFWKFDRPAPRVTPNGKL